MSRRRHALLLGGLALVLGGLAASNVAGREAALTRRVGALVDVVVAREPIPAGSPVRPAALAVRRVPRRFAPADAIGSAHSLRGLRAAVDIPQDTDLTPAMVGSGRPPPLGPAIGRSERVAEVVALGSPELVIAGSRVDVLVTPEPGSGEAGAALLALEDVEVLAAAPAQGEEEPASMAKSTPGTHVTVSLRVTLRQAVYLAAAQDFARQIRLLPRAVGDRGRGHAGLRMAAE
jgi:pilus assembly protein CpaB